jgi:flavin-dependent dehydrogenase
MDELGISLDGAHRIAGVRMIANSTVRELDWPSGGRFPDHGAVWPRRRLDAALIDAATEAGADVRWETEALPTIDNGRVVGVEANGEKYTAPMTVIATGAPGAVAKMLGTDRVQDEPFGLAIRAYAESPRHASEHLEACLTLKDEQESWGLGPYQERPRAWRLPMSAQRRHGDGWVAIGDAAGLINPMNGEGIDYGLESGMLAADFFLTDPATAPERYDAAVGDLYDAFLSTGRRFSFLIGHPWILKNGLRLAVGTEALSKITLQVMGNLVDSQTPGAAGRVFSLTDKALAAADPVLRRTRAAA